MGIDGAVAQAAREAQEVLQKALELSERILNFDYLGSEIEGEVLGAARATIVATQNCEAYLLTLDVAALRQNIELLEIAVEDVESMDVTYKQMSVIFGKDSDECWAAKVVLFFLTSRVIAQMAGLSNAKNQVNQRMTWIKSGRPMSR
jgi:hypothetical protein